MKARLLLFPFLMFPFTWSWLELIKVVVTVFAFFDRDEVVDRSKRVHQLHLRSGVELWRVIVDSPSSSEDFVGAVYPEGAMLTGTAHIWSYELEVGTARLCSSSGHNVTLRYY
jgi:hypothetical protein